jgi:hypothetical protein
MRRSLALRPCLWLAVVVLMDVSQARSTGAPILSLDFDSDTPVTQTGFTSVVTSSGGTNAPFTEAFGPITLTLAIGVTNKNTNGDLIGSGTAVLISRDRGIPGSGTGFAYSALYRDFVNINSSTLGIEFAGLTANTSYDITFYSYDNTNTRVSTFTDVTPGGTADAGSVSYTAGTTFNSATPTNIDATTVRGTTDAQGRLFFAETATGSVNGNPILNGLQINPVPEPTPLAAMVTGVGGLLAFGRRRKTRRR